MILNPLDGSLKSFDFKLFLHEKSLFHLSLARICEIFQLSVFIEPWKVTTAVDIYHFRMGKDVGECCVLLCLSFERRNSLQNDPRHFAYILESDFRMAKGESWKRDRAMTMTLNSIRVVAAGLRRASTARVKGKINLKVWIFVYNFVDFCIVFTLYSSFRSI